MNAEVCSGQKSPKLCWLHYCKAPNLLWRWHQHKNHAPRASHYGFPWLNSLYRDRDIDFIIRQRRLRYVWTGGYHDISVFLRCHGVVWQEIAFQLNMMSISITGMGWSSSLQFSVSVSTTELTSQCFCPCSTFKCCLPVDVLLAVSVLLPCPRHVACLVSKVALSFGLVLPLQNMPHICQQIHASLYTTDTDLHTSEFFPIKHSWTRRFANTLYDKKL